MAQMNCNNQAQYVILLMLEQNLYCGCKLRFFICCFEILKLSKKFQIWYIDAVFHTESDFVINLFHKKNLKNVTEG